LKVAPDPALPLYVKMVVALVVELLTQIAVAAALNALVGVSLTVIVTLVIGELHDGTPGFCTLKVTVLFPIEFQLTVCGP